MPKRKSLKITCDNDDILEEVLAWLKEYWSEEIKSKNVRYTDTGDYPFVEVSGSPKHLEDLKDDVIEVYGSSINADWSTQ
jgi:hypothetical protein